jgi:hypothetical protein
MAIAVLGMWTLMGLNEIQAQQQQISTVEVAEEPPLPPPLALPLVAPEDVPESGTFYSAQKDEPPIPFNPFPALPVYSIGTNLFLFDDRTVDYLALEQERQTLQELRTTAKALGMEADFVAEFGEGAGLGPEGGNTPMSLMSFPSNSLWLEIMGVTNGALPEGIADLILHGTQPDVLYLLLSKETLTDAVWVAEQTIVGASGQDWTQTNAVVGSRTNTLFFMAASLADSDGDGLPDWWELENGFDPDDPADGAADTDSDGYTNFDEFLLAQDPHSADPARPTITVAMTDANAAEPADPGTFTLERNGDVSRTLTVYYTLSGRARNAGDFEPISGEAVFAVGQSVANVNVQPMDDNLYEGSEDVTLAVLPGLHYFNGTTTTGIVAIADNEIQPIKVRAWPDEVAENSSTPGVFQFTRSGDTRLALTVNFTLTGTATNGINYQSVPLNVTFAADLGETNVFIYPINNTNFFGARVAQLSVSPNAAYYAETNCAAATVTITEDDKPVVQVLADDSDAREGSPVRNGRFKFIRTGATTSPLELSFAVHGTAIPGGDYTEFPALVTIPPSSNFVYLTVQPTNDTASELRETVIVVLRGSEAYSIGASNAATVFIDDNEATAYDWELLTASAINDTGIDLPAEIVIRRYGSTLATANFDFTVTDQNGTVVLQPADLFAGDVDNNYSPFQLPGDLRNWVTFNNRRSEAHVLVHHPVSTWTPAGFYPSLHVYVTNLFTTNYQTVYFHGREQLVRAEFLTNQIPEGGTNYLRLSRSVPGVWSPVNTNDLNVTISVSGLASAGVDHDLVSQAVTFPLYLRSMDIPVAALSDSDSEGWESVYVRLNALAANYRPDTRPGTNWMAAMSIGDPGLTNNFGLLDSDEDGMADTWERTYGLNPFVFNDPYADEDGDGMPNLEEALNGSNPNVRDSDADGVDDATEWTHGSDASDPGENTINPASDYVPIKLATASCYRCHQTTLSAGQHSLTSVPPVRGKTADSTRREQIFQFLKGAATRCMSVDR